MGTKNGGILPESPGTASASAKTPRKRLQTSIENGAPKLVTDCQTRATGCSKQDYSRTDTPNFIGFISCIYKLDLPNFSADVHLEILLDFTGGMCYTEGKNSMIACNANGPWYTTFRPLGGIYWPRAGNCYGQ